MSNTQELKQLVKDFIDTKEQDKKAVTKAAEESQKAREESKAEPDHY